VKNVYRLSASARSAGVRGSAGWRRFGTAFFVGIDYANNAGRRYCVEVVVAWHFMALAAFLVQPDPCSASLGIDILHAEFSLNGKGGVAANSVD